MTPRNYTSYSLSVIPCRDDKRPLRSWASAMVDITDPGEATHYGIVCGAVSGNLECIDYDRKGDTDGTIFAAFRDLIQSTHPYLWERLLIERTVNGGVHIVYRCPENTIDPAQKLAFTERHAVFETKGEGGYFVCAPSPGYTLIQGEYQNVPIITGDERELLLNAARSFDQRPEEEQPSRISERAHESGSLGFAGGISPFDDYDLRGDVIQLLLSHGWSVSHVTNSVTYLTRPGKRHGISATYNFIPGKVRVFTTSTQLEPRAYKPCAVYAILEHAGNFKAAAQALINLGYGRKGDPIPRTRTVTLTDGTQLTGHEIPHADIITAAFHNQLGDATLFHKIAGHTIAYDTTAATWYVFDDPVLRPGHWAQDPEALRTRMLLIEYLIDTYTKALETESTNLPTDAEELTKDVRKQANQAQARVNALNSKISQLRKGTYTQAVLSLAKSFQFINGTQWDQDPALLGVANGVIDLKTTTLRPAQPTDYIRKVCPTNYNPSAPAPRFQRFIHEIHGEIPEDDAPITDFMHKLLGYAITGYTTEHIYPILWGREGRNGKDTLLDTILTTLGPEIAKPAAKDTVISSGRRNTGQASPELYDLWGARIVWVNETEESDRLKAAQLKELSGGGVIKCRPLHGNMVEFKPTHLGLLVTNDKPQAPSDDTALWARIVLIPYVQRFVDNPTKPNEHQADKMLKYELARESEGILAWLVRGCRRWQDEGLQIPDALKAQTADYRSELDSLTEWFEECCEVDATAAISHEKAYKSYSEWCQRNGYHPYGPRRFGAIMEDKGYPRVRQTAGLKGRGYMGFTTSTTYVGNDRFWSN